MISNDYLKTLDWDTAIAAAEIPIKKEEARTFLAKGMALCFKEDKDNKYKDAVDALSRAIAAPKEKGGNDDLEQAKYYRAYAYYLSGNFERALKDCCGINDPVARNMMKGKIMLAMERNAEAVKVLGMALKKLLPDKLPSPGLLEDYREACRLMNNQ